MTEMKRWMTVVAAVAALVTASGTATATPTARVCATGGCEVIPVPVAIVVIVGPEVVKVVQKLKCKARGLKVTCKKR